MLTCALTACRLLEGLKETKEASQAPGLSNKLKRLVGKFVPEAGVIILVGIGERDGGGLSTR